MKFKSKEELNYLAGFIDSGRMKIQLKRHRVRLRMKGNLPSLLKHRFGGSVYKHRGLPHFEAQGKNAFRLLTQVLPYLVYKRKKARLFIEEWNEH